MVESASQSPHRNQGEMLALIGQKLDMLVESHQEMKSEFASLRHVVVGNGDSHSLVNQVQSLHAAADVAQTDRTRMEKRINSLADCVSAMERDGISDRSVINKLEEEQESLANNMLAMKAEQEEQGELIAAFRNRVIGIVAVLSLLTGAGAGFAIAARLLQAAVP